MPELDSVRTTAEAIGRITCIRTGEEIGLLYQWNNGETQAALYDGGHPNTPHRSDHPAEPDLGAKRS
ncbi:MULTISPECIES: hypothetical protein [unclassified Ruegeria]|uniref:hypothetical protein n=1 Tax=unclassified Ruegeria TaxID=2625375 RepID=UPI001AE6CCAE|nr:MULTISPECIES: hypothetical protein [unclassified Ruegeria]